MEYMITISLYKPLGLNPSLEERFNPLYDVLGQMNKLTRSLKYISTSLHFHSVPHSILHNQLFEAFKHITYCFDEVLKEKVALQSNSPHCLYLLEETRDNVNFTQKCIATKLGNLEDSYKKLFQFPMSFLRKQLPRISGVFTGLSPLDFNEELPWAEKVRIFDPQTRNITTKEVEFKIPRNILVHFYITTEEICVISYNFQEELFVKFQRKLDELADWANRRYRLLQVIMNDRISLGVQKFNKKRTKRESVLIKRMDSSGFINMINKPFVSAATEAAFQKWNTGRIFKQTSNTNLGDLATNYTKSVQCYAKNLFLDVNKQKSLLPFDSIIERVITFFSL